VKENGDGFGSGFIGAALRYTAIATMLPGGIAAGYFIGLGLDHWLGTTYLKIVFLLLGIAGGFAQLIRELMRGSLNKPDKK
jgi:F0F1-type ATP synthase assembly protein I